MCRIAKILSVLICFYSPFGVADIENSRDWYIGLSVPFQGYGFYENKDNSVSVWNLTPLSLETEMNPDWGLRWSIYTVYSIPKPKRIGEFEFNVELPYYFVKSEKLTLSGFYFGPMLMLQYHDQDSRASLGGPGITIGYRGILSENYWYRIGSYFAYHRYLFGPKDKLHKITEGSDSGGLFMGLTIFEVGAVF